MAETLFYVLAAGTLGCGVGVIAARQPLFSLLSLLGAFFCLSGIYLLSGFQFLAATQLLVYAGAIMVLFLFVIMLLNLGDERELARQTGLGLSGRKLAVACAAAGTLAVVGIVAAGWGEVYVADPAVVEQGIDDLDSLAAVLFSRYMLAFEAGGLLLLATMIGVMVLAKRERPSRTRATDGTEGRSWPWKRGTPP